VKRRVAISIVNITIEFIAATKTHPCKNNIINDNGSLTVAVLSQGNRAMQRVFQGFIHEITRGAWVTGRGEAGPKPEAWRAERGVGFLGKESEPLPPARGLGSAV